MDILKAYKSLNIEKQEITPVVLLIVQSVFLGIFTGSFDIGAHALFLNAFPEEMIARAYIVSGFIGIILTALYSKLQSKINFSSLANKTLIFIAFLSALMWLMSVFSTSKWVFFFIFIMFGPLNILAIVTFWGTVSRIFNLRQGKRLYGIIDTGQIFGIILSSYIIPLVLVFLSGTKDLLLFCSGSIVFALLLEIVISKKYNLNNTTNSKQDANDDQETNHQVKIIHFTKNPYILFMALFVIFSMFTAFFVQFSFLVTIKEQYPTETELARYLGFFTGSMMIFTFLIKTFIYSKFVKTYGLKTSLIVSPILIGIFTLMAIIAGYFTGTDAGSKGFVYFFLLISLSKLFNKALKDSLEMPSFKLLYQSLDKKIRFDIQAKMDGTVNEISALTSGILLSILGILSFITLIHYSVFLLFILVSWTVITILLYRYYRKSLEQSLDNKSISSTFESSDIEISNQISAKESNSEKRKMAEMLRNYCSIDYLEWNENIFKALKQSKNLADSDDFSLSLWKDEIIFSSIENKNKANAQEKYTNRELARLINSSEEKTYLQAINYIIHKESTEQLSILSALMRYPNVNVQKTAILLCGLLKQKETCHSLVDFLSSTELKPDALIALKVMMPDITKSLIQSFYKTDISHSTQIYIIDLLEYATDFESIKFLMDNLSTHKTSIISHSLKTLIKRGYFADENDRPRLFQVIQQTAKILAWDISALASISVKDQNRPLFQSLRENYYIHSHWLMNVLSITFNPESVQRVQEYLESGTSDGISYGLELLDLFISDEVKPFLLPIFEDMPLVEKTRELQKYFPVKVYNYDELILTILSRDPNLVSTYTKELALEEYQRVFSSINSELIALLYSPVDEINCQAARIMKEIDEQTFVELSRRIPQNQRQKWQQKKQIPVDAKEAVFKHLSNLTGKNLSGNILYSHWNDYATIEIFREEMHHSVNNQEIDFLLKLDGDKDEMIIFKNWNSIDFEKIRSEKYIYYKVHFSKNNLQKMMNEHKELLYPLINLA